MIGRIAFVSLLIAVCATLIFAGREIIGYLEMAVDLQRLAREQMLNHPAIVAIIIVYIVLLAIPFVPGAELGLLLLVVFGAEIAGLVYLATLAAMSLSFIIGRLVPEQVLHDLFMRLGFVRVAAMLKANAGDAGSFHRQSHGANRWLARLLRYRSISLAVLINTPGNTLIGGGGGIAMAAGASRLFTFGQFLLSTSIAIAPAPLIVVSAAWLSQ